MRWTTVKGIVAALIGMSFPDGVDAIDKTFVGTPGMPDWFDDDHWQPAGVPGEGDDVILSSLRTAVLSADTAIHNLTLDTGALDGTGTLLLHGRLNWKGGGMGNTVAGIATTTVELGMDLPFPSSGARTVIDRVLNLNGGTSTLSGPDGFGLGGNATLNLDDDAVFEAVNDGGGLQYIVAAPGVFNIHGTFRKTAGNSGTTQLGNIEVNNFGNVEVLSGRLELSGSGTAHDGGKFQVATGATLRFATSDYHLLPGSQVTGAGKVEVFGALEVGGIFAVPTIEETGGAATFTAPVTIAHLILMDGNIGGDATLTVTDSLVWTNGFMIGSGITNAENDVNLSGGLKEVNGRTINLKGGTATVAGGTRFRFENGTFNNNALFEVKPLQGGGGGSTTFQGSGMFANSGTLRATSTISFAGVQFVNSGTVEVGPNVVMTVGGGYTQTAGTTRVLANTTLVSSFATPTLHFDGGTLEGSGTVQATVVNAAQVRPGLSAGRLFIAGDYTQMPSGSLAVEIGGRTPYTQYDALESTGQIALAGGLEVSLINGFVPVKGDKFQIVFAGTRSGAFDSASGLVIGGGLGFAVRLGTRDVMLEVVFEDCSNGMDDDGDGNTDCADPKCGAMPPCTGGASATPTATRTPSASRTPTATSSPTSTTTPTGPTPTRTETFTPGPSPTRSATPDPSLPTLTPTTSGTPTPTATPTPIPTSSVPTATRTLTFTPGPSPTPTATRDPSLPTFTPTATPSITPTSTITPTPTPTATPTPVECGVGDCDGSDAVTIDELVRIVERSLRAAPPPAGCLPNGEQPVTLDDVLAAVRSALRDCR